MYDSFPIHSKTKNSCKSRFHVTLGSVAKHEKCKSVADYKRLVCSRFLLIFVLMTSHTNVVNIPIPYQFP